MSNISNGMRDYLGVPQQGAIANSLFGNVGAQSGPTVGTQQNPEQLNAGAPQSGGAVNPAQMGPTVAANAGQQPGNPLNGMGAQQAPTPMPQPQQPQPQGAVAPGQVQAPQPQQPPVQMPQPGAAPQQPQMPQAQ